MELDIKGIDGKASGSKISLDQDVFDAAFNESLVHQVVIAVQAGARQGTRAQKKIAPRFAVAAASHGARKAPAAPVRAPRAARFGAVVAGHSPPQHAISIKK